MGHNKRCKKKEIRNDEHNNVSALVEPNGLLTKETKKCQSVSLILNDSTYMVHDHKKRLKYESFHFIFLHEQDH